MANTNITSELLDSLLAGRDPKTVFAQDGLLDELKKALAERILSAELDHHLGQDEEQAVGNHRNGRSQKTVLTVLQIATPTGSSRHARRWADSSILQRYSARPTTTV